MPSLKAEEAEATTTARIKDVFATERVKDILQKTKNEARKRATEIIQREIPNFIAHLNGLIEGAKNDANSPLWQGHLKTGPFIKENVKLVFEFAIETEESRDGRRKGTPKIGIEDAHELSLKDVPLKPEYRRRVNDHLGIPGPWWKGHLVCNSACDRLMDLLEAECETATLISQELAHWVRLSIPTFEDGNNFGTDVQEKMLESIEDVAHTAMKAHGTPKTHYDDRIQLARSWNQFPGLKDHAAAIASSDQFDFFLATTAITELRDNMVELLLHVGNNWAKVHDPKNAGRAGAVY